MWLMATGSRNTVSFKGRHWNALMVAFGQERKFIAANMMPVPITGKAESMPAAGLAAVLQGPLFPYFEPVVS